MNTHGRLKLEGTLQQVSTALEYLMGQLARSGSSDDRDAIELGLSELLSNIVRHGYGGKAGPIRLTWSADEKRITVRVADRGKPIPKGSLEEAASTRFDFDDTTPLHALPEGGMGLVLVQRSFHKLRYRSRWGVNRLTAVRRMRR